MVMLKDLSKSPVDAALRRLAASLALVAVSVGLSFLYGMNSWSIGSAESWASDLGRVICGLDNPRVYLQTGICPTVGYPAGTATDNGLIVTQIPVLIGRVFRLSAVSSLSLWYIIMIAIGFAGAVLLFKRLGMNRTSYFAALIWMMNPSVIGMRSFGSTFWGFLLLPAFIAIALASLRLLAAGTWWQRLLALPLWCLFSTISIKTDGYAYVMLQSSVAALVLLGPLLKHNRSWRESGLGLILFIPGLLVSYGIYTYGNAASSDWGTMPIDFFRGMGADVVSFFYPTRNFAWASLLGIGMDPTWRWGDGTNNSWNYIGFSVLILLIMGMFWSRKGRGQIGTWALIGMVSLLLSLGPSLKVNAISGPPAVPVTMDAYLMPADQATFTFPWADIFVTIPGISMMRATYRWMVLVRLALIVILALVLERLFDKWGSRSLKTIVAVCLAAFAAMAWMPAFQSMLQTQRNTARSLTSFQEEVPPNLDRLLPDGGIVAITSPVSGGNDFLAPLISSEANITLYNTAGDKDLAEAEAYWNSDVKDVIVTRKEYADSVYDLLKSGEADAVVITNFDLRWGISYWPNLTYKDVAATYVDQVGKDNRLSTASYDDFVIVTLK
jgi:hypothetical protein